MSAITEKGFLRPTYAQLLEAQQGRAREYFGDDIDVGEYSVLGKFIRITVYDLARLYEELEAVYFARFPNYAQGINLDRLMPFAGITRNPAVAAVVLVRFFGDPGADIPAGFRVATGDGVLFRTEQTLTIGAGGEVDAPVTCVERGAVGNVPAGSITVVVNPVVQVSGVLQLEQLTEGRAAESDAELRARFSVAVAGIGSATRDAVLAAVTRVPGVVGCEVVENATGQDDPVSGVPAHSFEAYVLGDGALDEDVGAAIFSKKAIGIHSHGDVAVQVPDSAGNLHEVRFSRVAEVALWVRAALKVNTLFPADGAAVVADALAGAVNTMPNGRDLVYSALFPVIYQVPGVVEISSLALSTDGGESWGAGNVVVSPAAAVRLDRGHVDLEVAPYADQ